ncbi:MAG: SpoIIE family protein phosphatase [Candidatus Eisenbacteria bacterium]|nr:SpoIIE family protein phosphatase [Candidatus Eisenbacteria bacterium]
MAFALTGKIKGRSASHFLRDGEQIVGRAATSHVRLPDSSVSRTHAKIVLEDGRVTLTDLGSSNGTFVNGAPLTQPRELELGDVLAFADIELKFIESMPPEETMFSQNGSSIESSSVTLEEIFGPAGGGDERTNLFRILAEAGELLATQRPLAELYEMILDLVEKLATCDKAVLLLIEQGKKEPVVKASRLKPGSVEGELVLSRTMVQKVIEQRSGLLTSDAQQDPRFQQQQSIVSQGIRSAMAAPLFDNEKVIGILYADTTDPASWYNRDELRTFTSLANLIGVKITQARLAEAEEEGRRLAREVQAAKDILAYILPTDLGAAIGYEMGTYHEPCLEVGGDLYDVKCLEDGRVLFLAGDVAGKGLGAALLVSNIMPIISVLIDGSKDLTKLVTRLNRQIFLSTDPVHYATLFLGVLDPSTGDVEYVNAGHNPPYLLTPNCEIEEVAATGTPIGLLEGAPFELGKLTIAPGAILFLFSDGIPEAQNADGEFYEDERLRDLVCSERDNSASEIVASVRADLERFVGDASPTDDITMLLLKRTLAAD